MRSVEGNALLKGAEEVPFNTIILKSPQKEKRS